MFISANDLRRDNVAILAKKKKIEITGCWISAYTDEKCKILAEVIRTTTSLETLFFGDDDVIALQNDEVVDALAKNRTIKILDLGWTYCGDEGAKAVANILKENSTIEVVTLSFNIIGVAGAKVIAEALKENTSLQKLFLSDNSIGVEGAKAIAEALKENISLRELNIGWNNIGDQGAKAIAEALKENSSLQGLCIQSNRIGEEGGKDIINALQQIERSAIENIYLFENKISEETRTKIKQEIIRIQNRFKSVGSNEGQATEDGGIQGDENTRKSSNEDEQLPTTSQGSAETNETRNDIKAMETKISEMQSTIAQQLAESTQKDREIAKKDKEVAQATQRMAELQSTIAQQQAGLALKQEEIASLRMQRLNRLDVGSDDLENYTKCCVCLEPYEEGPTSTDNQRRLPIKSATCAHSLCEGCLDAFHASLMNGRSTLRYVRCPQCNDKTKKAFDIRNKVVDFFLREYIQCRKRKKLA